MKDIRYLIRLTNAPLYRPERQAELLAQARAAAQPLGGRVINLRIASRAVEFDLFVSPEKSLDPFFAAWKSIGSRLTCRSLSEPELVREADQIVPEALRFFEEERFWEVHETLESLWKARRGAEKTWVQGMILVAAALVHQQKNEMSVMRLMLTDALRRLDGAPQTYHGWNLKELREFVSGIIKTSI